MQDILTHYIMLMPTVGATSDTASRILFDSWICIVGFPQTLSSDRGTYFTSELFQAVCQEAGIRQQFGAPYHPRSQAQVERQNQQLDNLRCMNGNNVDEWRRDGSAPTVQSQHVNCATTGQSPHQLVFGLPARRPKQVIARETSNTNPDFTPDLINATVMQKLVREKMRRIQKAAQVEKEKVASTQSKRILKYQSRGAAFRVEEIMR